MREEVCCFYGIRGSKRAFFTKVFVCMSLALLNIGGMDMDFIMGAVFVCLFAVLLLLADWCGKQAEKQ